MTDQKIPFLKLYERRSKSTGLTISARGSGDLRLVIFRDRDEDVNEADLLWRRSPVDRVRVTR